MTADSDDEPWPTGQDIWDYVQHTKSLLRKKLPDGHYVDSFTIQKDPQTVFCMFFFTPHIRGFEKMLEAKWKLNRETGMGWHYSAADGHDDLFSNPEPQTRILERELSRLLDEHFSVSNEQVYFRTVEQGFLPKHARQVLAAWQREKRILVTPNTTPQGAFYLDYKSHQKDGRVISISKSEF